MSATTDTNQDQLRRAIEQLYEDERLTRALTDEPATILLSWGEQQLNKFASTSLSQAELDRIGQDLRRTMRQAGRLVEQRADLSDTEMVQKLLKLMDQTIMLALPTQKTDSEEFADDQTTQTFAQEINPEEQLW